MEGDQISVRGMVGNIYTTHTRARRAAPRRDAAVVRRAKTKTMTMQTATRPRMPEAVARPREVATSSALAWEKKVMGGHEDKKIKFHARARSMCASRSVRAT